MMTAATPNPIDDITAFYQAVPLEWRVVATAVLCLAIAVVAFVQIRRALKAFVARVRSISVEDILTIVAASIATGVSAEGMWRFTGDVLALWWPLRVVLFAFIEVAIVTSAVRARRSMRENFSAGVDGIAVWALTCLTAVLSSMDASSLPEAIFRLTAPLVAAWLWERGMRLERHRIRGTSSIHWRLTPERVMVWLGLAEASDRTAGEVDRARRLDRLASAAVKADDLQNASDRKRRKAVKTVRRALAAAVEHAGLAVDEAAQQGVLQRIDTLRSADALMTRRRTARWADPVTEEQKAAAAAAMEELARLDATEATQRALDRTAVRLMSLTPDMTPELIKTGVNGHVNNHVNGTAVLAPRNGSGLTPELSPDVTPRLTVERVNEPLNFDVNDGSVYDLERMLSADPYVTPKLTPELTSGGVNDGVNDDADSASKTQVMKDFWDAEVAEDRYPSVTDLARHAGVDPSLASRKRKEWVAALPWRRRRRAESKKTNS